MNELDALTRRLVTILAASMSLALASGCTQEIEPVTEPDSTILSQSLTCDSEGQLELFNARIRPMLDEQKPNSCARCHLPGTNLAAFVRPDPCEAMACMTQQKLVDLRAPGDSKILAFILRGHAEAGVALEDDPLVSAEYAAFKEWIEYSSRCHEEVCGQITNACDWTSTPPPLPDMGAPDLSDLPDMMEEVEMGPCGTEKCPLTPEHYGCEPTEIARAYFEHPWEWRGRCEHCHGESANFSSNPPAPRWLSDDRGIAGAEWTVQQIIQNRYIDEDFPDRSLILVKPLAENAGGIPHGGGTKVRDTNDVLHVAHSNWINHVLYCRAQE